MHVSSCLNSFNDICIKTYPSFLSYNSCKSVSFTSSRFFHNEVRFSCEDTSMISPPSSSTYGKRCNAFPNSAKLKTLPSFPTPNLLNKNTIASSWFSNPIQNFKSKSSPSSSFTLAASSSKQNVPSESNDSSSSLSNPSPFQSFPWKKLGTRFIERIGNLIWFSIQIIFIPTFFIFTLGELAYAIRMKKLALVLVGLVLGTVLTGITKETYYEFFPQYANKETPWHLIILGTVFVFFKLVGPVLPVWAKVLIPQFANGGLWQVGLGYFQFKKSHS